MKRFTVVVVLTLFGLFSAGCASKNYVRSQTGPVIDKVNELDDLTAKNTRDIKDVDTRLQRDIQQVNTKANAADQPHEKRQCNIACLGGARGIRRNHRRVHDPDVG